MSNCYTYKKIRPVLGLFALFLSITTMANAQGSGPDNTPKILIHPSDTTIALGDTLSFQATLPGEPNSTFSWSVSDSTIATIDQEGVFLAISEGKVNVTATMDSLSASVEVEIEEEDDEREQEELLRIIPSDTTITVGQALYLQAQYKNQSAWTDTLVTWTISDTSLVTLKGDSLFAEKAGELKVFANLDSLSAEAEIEIEGEEKEEEGEDDDSEYMYSIVPADTVVEPGSEVTFRVFAEQTSEFITDSLSWNLSDELGTIDTNGTAILTDEGFGFVDATYQGEKIRTSIRVQELVEDSSGTQSIVVNIPRNNPNVPPAVHNLKEGEELRLSGFASPLNYLNGGSIYFPPGSLTENIRIDVSRDDVTSSFNDSSAQNTKIVGGIGFDVFVEDSLVSPYYFERPVEISIPYKKGLLKNLGIDVENLSMFYLENDGDLDSTSVRSVVTDTLTGRIFGEVYHFSTYVLSPKKSVTTHTEDVSNSSPSSINLSQNYPNPFNPTTFISVELPNNAEVNLSVYDVLGRKVATIIDNRLSMGAHTFRFNGSTLSSGLYIYRLSVNGSIVETKIMTLLK